jgi:hypothetical protein
VAFLECLALHRALAATFGGLGFEAPAVAAAFALRHCSPQCMLSPEHATYHMYATQRNAQLASG